MLDQGQSKLSGLGPYESTLAGYTGKDDLTIARLLGHESHLPRKRIVVDDMDLVKYSLERKYTICFAVYQYRGSMRKHCCYSYYIDC